MNVMLEFIGIFSVVSLNLCKEHLNVATFKISLLLDIKNIFIY